MTPSVLKYTIAKETLNRAEIDTCVFFAWHLDTKQASLSLTDIMKSAWWSSEATFAKLYHRELKNELWTSTFC